MIAQFYNARTAAAEIGCSEATVSRWAERLGMTRKHGPSLLLTQADVDKIREHWHGRSGNPNFGKKQSRHR